MQITVYSTLSIGVHDPFSDFATGPYTLRQLIRCQQEFHGSPRYDWVVVYDLADKDFETRQGIDRYLFAQVRLLFGIKHNEQAHYLAYLEWYDIVDVPGVKDANGRVKMVARDPETQMAVAVRSGRFNVVSVSSIIRAVHMQPLFKERDSARKAFVDKLGVYSFNSYFVNRFADRVSWEELY